MKPRVAAYCFDTSVFVDPWRRYFPKATFPSLWERMAALLRSGAVLASESVYADIKRKPDDLHAWVKEHALGIFRADDEAVQREMKKILRIHPKLVSLSHGHSDPFVIAHAVLTGTTVVTQERHRSLVKPKIPDVCRALGVPCIAPLDLMAAEHWSF
ncbi:MAG: DUF4411 family protein [Deltaproteobacteria bacterium]|nr:DUF4411 family protein [Deltaproteobacteria bacterium]